MKMGGLGKALRLQKFEKKYVMSNEVYFGPKKKSYSIPQMSTRDRSTEATPWVSVNKIKFTIMLTPKSSN